MLCAQHLMLECPQCCIGIVDKVDLMSICISISEPVDIVCLWRCWDIALMNWLDGQISSDLTLQMKPLAGCSDTFARMMG